MKQFHLGDVLSITHDRLVSPRHMAGVYDILNYMTGDNLFTHQLPRAARECKPHLLAQHPLLAKIDADDFDSTNWREWLDAQCAEYGEYLAVAPLPKHAHEFIDPISEAAEFIPPDKIIVVTAPADTDRRADTTEGRE